MCFGSTDTIQTESGADSGTISCLESLSEQGSVGVIGKNSLAPVLEQSDLWGKVLGLRFKDQSEAGHRQMSGLEKELRSWPCYLELLSQDSIIFPNQDSTVLLPWNKAKLPQQVDIR